MGNIATKFGFKYKNNSYHISFGSVKANTQWNDFYATSFTLDVTKDKVSLHHLQSFKTHCECVMHSSFSLTSDFYFEDLYQE